MTFRAKEELAMILPLPVKHGSDEKAVKFINLSGYPEFFSNLESGFPKPLLPDVVTNSMAITAAAAPVKQLEVIKVGNFEASFVPKLKDFSRLDARFRISDKAWKKLPQYSNHGFAVFKLKKGHVKVHPMAFSFPRHDAKTVFFPTVHIHDGKVHDKAEFDHTLYCQPSDSEPLKTIEWEESSGNAGRFVDDKKAKGIILADHHCYKKSLVGNLPNRDTFVKAAM